VIGGRGGFGPSSLQASSLVRSELLPAKRATAND
jgi:hypothetical protein